jgi:ABC-type Co2+ transport system permease subunit
MGLCGPAVAWLLWKALGRWAPRAGAFVAAYVGLQVSTAVVALALALQHALSPVQFPTPGKVMAAAMFLPSLTVAGVAEGLFTAIAFALLSRVRDKLRP